LIAVDAARTAEELRADPDALSDDEIRQTVGALDRDLPDFYFTLFAELSDGSKVETAGSGRWYIGCYYPDPPVGDPETQLIEAIKQEVGDEAPAERWRELLGAFRTQGLNVDLDALEQAPFVVEFAPSAQTYLERAREKLR
jgi:hypothetical protein